MKLPRLVWAGMATAALVLMAKGISIAAMFVLKAI